MTNSPDQSFKNLGNKNKKFTRKFIEQQATKGISSKKMINQREKAN